MSKFKEGDKVVRTGSSGYYAKKGQEYTVSRIAGIRVSLVGLNGDYRAENFELVKEEKPMNKFKVGDKVICKNDYKSVFLDIGREYTVSSADKDCLTVEGSQMVYAAKKFELAPTLTPQKHQKEIIAWANGATIQYWSVHPEGWTDVVGNRPSWISSIKYRVKPDKSDEIEAEVAKLYEEIDKNRKAIADLEGLIVKLYSSGEQL